MKKMAMFWLIVARSLYFRKLRSLVVILAIVLGTGVVGGLVNVYYDMSQKMAREFRTYGANLLIYPAGKQEKIELATIDQIPSHLPKESIVGLSPNRYEVVALEGKPVVLVGAWMDQMIKVSPYWKVEGEWIHDRENVEEIMVGGAVAKKYDVKINTVLHLDDKGKQVAAKVKGIVSTGGAEDNQIFANMKMLEGLAGTKHADVVLINTLAKGSELEQAAQSIQQDVSKLSAKPLKQMVNSEEKLLEKIRRLIYFVAITIFITTVLTVSSTMVSTIMERRKEVGLKKAIGATDQGVMAELLVEGGMIAMQGSVMGMLFAYCLSQLIGHIVFQSEIAFRAVIIPWTLLGSLLVMAVAFFLPMRRVMEVEPAIVLKGE
ncbi:MAG TPA: ABC transporter permease [Bacillota bacterium]|nr:ABC transporter permease [Bacillota bacterium]